MLPKPQLGLKALPSAEQNRSGKPLKLSTTGRCVTSMDIGAFQNLRSNLKPRIPFAMATTEPYGLPAAARIAKRSLVISGHRTSVSLEGIFWDALKAAATARSQSVASLVADIDATRGEANLSSAIRVYLFSRDRVRDISAQSRA